MAKAKVLMTGAAGYIASQILPTFRARYELVLVDVTQ
jgi:nucleoside-diphosphate-sugar epimerase